MSLVLKIRPRKAHEGPEGEQVYSSTMEQVHSSTMEQVYISTMEQVYSSTLCARWG